MTFPPPALFTPMNEQQIRAWFARHAATPDNSVRDYVSDLSEKLGDSIANRRKLYLDTRYWIYLRRAAMARAAHADHPKILNHIRSLVSSGAAVCPVSDVTWIELTKQTDPETLQATAELLDELSLGVTIMNEQERVIFEIDQFISHPNVTGSTPILKDRVWVKAGLILGTIIPTMQEWSSDQNLLAQKVCVDYFWNVTHREIIEMACPFPQMSDELEKTAAKITEDKRHYAHQVRSIEQAFAAEISGALSVFKDGIQDLILRKFCKAPGGNEYVPKEQAEESAQRMLNLLTNAFRLRPKIMAQRAPSLYAYAMCHAAMRMDKSRNFNGHDLLDIHHASSSIPYHDAVFTENPLRVLVTAGNVALDKTFDCTVLAKETEVLNYLSTLSNE